MEKHTPAGGEQGTGRPFSLINRMNLSLYTQILTK